MAKSSAKSVAAKEILAAIQSKDAAALEAALCAFLELEGEYEEDDEDED